MLWTGLGGGGAGGTCPSLASITPAMPITLPRGRGVAKVLVGMSAPPPSPRGLALTARHSFGH